MPDKKYDYGTHSYAKEVEKTDKAKKAVALRKRLDKEAFDHARLEERAVGTLKEKEREHWRRRYGTYQRPQDPRFHGGAETDTNTRQKKVGRLRRKATTGAASKLQGKARTDAIESFLKKKTKGKLGGIAKVLLLGYMATKDRE